MSDVPTKAVFLSYASQDAEAARRICESLRSGGVEVWFDADGGLEHGDEWDAKIRRQIKECVLFIPVISASTQARHEGYFRIEWDLAAERARGIASGVPFILPVVIDDTREPDALVPDRFRMVQWTKLRAGEVPPEVQQRFLKLWSHRTGVLKYEAAGAREEKDLPAAASARDAIRRPSAKHYALVGMAVLAMVAGAGWWLVGGKDKSSPTPEPVPAVKSGAAAAPLSEARQLVAKARALFENPSYTRDDLTLAEDLCKQALKLSPNDAEVWAISAEVSSEFIGGGTDRSADRSELARTQAERAVKLDPAATETRFAKACYLRRAGGVFRVEAEKILRELAHEIPGDPRVLISLGKVIWGNIGMGTGRNLQRADEALGFFAQAAKIPAGRAEALGEQGWLLFNLGRYAECESVIDESLQLRMSKSTIQTKVRVALARGDLPTARAALAKIPTDLLHSDAGVTLAATFWLSSREADQCLEALSVISRDQLSADSFRGPTDLLRGYAYQLAGKLQAARSAWQTALQVTERRLAEQPRDADFLLHRAYLLALLGERDAALNALRLYEEFYTDSRGLTVDSAAVHVLLDPPERVLDLLEVASPALPVGYLRVDPRFDLLRGNARFEALLARGSAEKKPDATSAKPDDKSVAVLAFANLSDDKGNEYFSDGISEELLTVLQKIPGLHVAARTSAFSFKGKNATAQEIGEKLGVAHLVEGSVQKSGNRVKISARLSRVATGEQLWSENFTRDLADVFAVQSEIAQTIVEQLRVQLGGATGAAAKAEIQAQVQAAGKGGTRNVEAHELYLQGKFFVNQQTVELAIHAAGLLRRAVELDPQFALAWAALSGAGLVRGGIGETKRDFEEGFKLAREAADRALALAPDLAAAHVARASLLLEHDFDWTGASAALQRARALAPSDPEVLALSAQLAFSLGQAERAVELGRQAVALDPANPRLREALGFALAGAKRYDEAKAEFRRITELSPSSPWGHGGISMVLTAQGKADEAVAEAAKVTMVPMQLYALAIAEWARGNKTAADAALAELIKSQADLAAVQIAWIYAFRHDNDRAFEWLERAYRQRDGGLAYTKANLALESLHSDPRWPAFWKKIGMTDEQLK